LTQGFFRYLVFSFTLVFLGFALSQITSTEAQVISGDLVGTVVDSSGAVVPGASIEATNTATGVKYTAAANSSGEYRFNNLPVGTYNVTAWAANFAKTTVSAFRVELNKANNLQISLNVSATATTVEVSGDVATVDTSTAQVTNTFGERQDADLPTASVGNGVLNLSLLGAGVTSSGGVGAGTGPSVGGQRPRNNNFMIEGVDNNDKSVTGPLVFVPNDAVAEFSLLQNQFSPEFGHSSGGQFNTVVKSGTNSFHGLAYIYNENRNYDALDTLQKREGFNSTPRFDQNRIGGQIGGPVLKNKLFFFVNYEYNPLGQAGGAGSTCAPTQAGFDSLNSISGLSATNLQIFESFVPPGTNTAAGCAPITVAGQTIPTAGLEVVAPSFTNGKFLTTSMDYDISSRDQLRGRYIYNSVIGVDTAATLPQFFLNQPNKFHLVAINEYHTFTPTLVNEFRLGYNRFDQIFGSGNFSFPGLDSFPNLQFNDLNFLQVGPDPNAPQFTVQNTYQAADAVTWTRGTHTLKFGIEGRKVIAPESFTQRSRGDYEYNTLGGYLQDLAPNSLAERSLGNPVFYGDQSSLYWFVNDDWRVRSNLTFNLGLRYEYTTIPTGQRLQRLNQAASVPGLIDFSEPRAAKNNWGPRVGFAYSPGSSGRTSIRAGAGISYDVLYDNLGILSLPPQLSGTVDCAPVGNFNCPQPFLANGGIPPSPGGVQTFPDVASQRAATAAWIPVNQKSPKSIDWTLGVQHTFGSDYIVEVRYVGTRGIHLPTQIQVNKQSPVTPSFFLPTFLTAPSQATLDASTTDLAAIENASNIVPAYDQAGFNQSNITAFLPAASSSYNGLAVQVTKRMSHGLQFLGAYTFSHTIDNATADVFSTVLAPRRPQDFQNLSADRGNSILDHAHRLTLAVIYDEPFFKNSPSFLRNTLGNWEIAPVYTYQSPQWTTVQSGVDANLNGDSAPDRSILNPNGVKGTGSGVVPLCNSTVATCPATLTDALDNPNGVVGYLAIDPNAQYIQTGYGALATVGRNTLPLDPINDVDLTLVKRFNFTERYKVEFQAQAFNLFNHPQYVGGSINQITSIGFTGSERSMLLPANTSFNQPQNVFASNARTMQLVLKLFF